VLALIGIVALAGVRSNQGNQATRGGSGVGEPDDQ
jgi:hypothetical protein